MELLRSSFILLLFAVYVSTDIYEDAHVSYSVDSVHESSVQQFVIDYEPLNTGRYRRQAGSADNGSTPLPAVTTEAPSTPGPATATAQAPVNSTPKSVPAASTPAPGPTTTAAPAGGPGSSTQAPAAGPTTVAPGPATTNSETREDNHQYYKSQIIPNAATDHWEDLSQAKRHNTLSKSHRTAVTIQLSFKFRFYGHNVTNVTVATGGFLYASPFLHQWLTATQYIAPLMANFDLNKGEASDIYYDDFGDRFAVQWRNVMLGDQTTNGTFDFQAQLFEDGTIKFLYRELPISISSISSSNHPVKIGVSDAFYIDSYIKDRGIRRRTIYEYHRVSFHGDQVTNGTAIVMSPLPTCNMISDCKDCVDHANVKFECKWCGAVGRCSDGIDWHRSEWINRGCSNLAHNNATICDMTTTSTTTSTTPSTSRSSTKLTTSPSTTVSPTIAAANTAKCPPVSGNHGNETDCSTTSSNLEDTSVSTTTNTASVTPTASSTEVDDTFMNASFALTNLNTDTASMTTTNKPDTTTTVTTTNSPTTHTTSVTTTYTEKVETTEIVPLKTITSAQVTSTSTKEPKTQPKIEQTSHKLALSMSTTTLTNPPQHVTSETKAESSQRVNPNIHIPYKIAEEIKASEAGLLEGEICDDNMTEGMCRARSSGFPIGAIVAIILILLVVFGGIGVWIFYAYTHPTSASGMWLMEHRPSQMKERIANIKFWKSSTPAGTKYQVESEA